MARAIVPIGFIFLIAAVVMFGSTAVAGISLREEHVVEREHTDALTFLTGYRDGVCAGKWVGYNIVRGQVMVKCRLPDTTPPKCLFVFYRVTENRGARLLTPGEAYNPTCMVEECWKYNSGYQGWNDSAAWGWDNAGAWVTAPLDLKAAIISAFGAP